MLNHGCTTEFNPELATCLPNGAEILARYCVPNSETTYPNTLQRWIVLCVRREGGGEFGLTVEYVTWCVDQKGNAYWGHYFGKRIGAAEFDYQARVTKGY